jgi:hypothetical protein
MQYRALSECDDKAGEAWAECRFSCKLFNNKDLLRIRRRELLLLWWGGAELSVRLRQVKGLTDPLEDGLGELGVGDSNLAEQVQVGGHHDPGTKVNRGRETGFVRKIVG